MRRPALTRTVRVPCVRARLGDHRVSLARCPSPSSPIRRHISPELTEGYGIYVVPLYVVLPGRSGREGLDVGPQDVARALAVRGQTVSTSRPTPGDFVAVYRAALDAGADRIVSIHLSGELSSTSDAARLAASQVGEHLVTVVDSRSAAMGCGFAVLAAARSAAAGADARRSRRRHAGPRTRRRPSSSSTPSSTSAGAAGSGPRPPSSARRWR